MGISETSRLKAHEYWRLIRLMIKRSDINLAIVVDKILSKDGSRIEIPFQKKNQNSSLSIYLKLRHMLFHLVTSTILSCQSVSKHSPHIKVSPSVVTIPSYGEVELSIELHLGNDDTFLATLEIISDIPNTAVYEIALTATPNIVNIFCDDTRKINFYRQPIGETELIVRNFKNCGHRDISFKFVNPNTSII
jgi:hypothetical protein